MTHDDLTEAVKREIDAECAKAGFKLQPHALDSFAQAAIAAMRAHRRAVSKAET